MQPFFDIEMMVPATGQSRSLPATSLFERRLPVTPVTPINRIIARPQATIPIYSRWLFNFNTSGLPIHLHPTEASPRLGVVPFGGRVSLVREGFQATPAARGGWALVVYAGRQGYTPQEWLAEHIPALPTSAPLSPTPEMNARYDIRYYIWGNRLDYGRFDRPHQLVEGRAVTMDQVRDTLLRIDPCHGVYRDRSPEGSGWYNIQSCDEDVDPGGEFLEGIPHTQQVAAVAKCIFTPWNCDIIPV